MLSLSLLALHGSLVAVGRAILLVPVSSVFQTILAALIPLAVFVGGLKIPQRGIFKVLYRRKVLTYSSVSSASLLANIALK